MLSILDQANKLLLAGKPGDAEKLLDMLLSENPDQVQAIAMLGLIKLNNEGPFDAAEVYLKKAIQLSPEDPSCHNNYGTLKWRQGNYETAKEHFIKAIQLRPDYYTAYINLANTERELGSLSNCANAYRAAIQIRPDKSKVRFNLGVILSESGNWYEALESLNQAIAVNPDYAMARFMRGMLHLKLGHLREGWKDYEWRFEATGCDYITDDKIFRNIWDGEPFIGKTLLVYHDQGLGDAIQFIRYLPMVKQLGGRVLFLCGPKLFKLFKGSNGYDELINRWTDHKKLNFDYHIALMSLPYIFDTTLENIPVMVPYINIERETIDKWKEQIGNSKSYKIGIAWSGKDRQGENDLRSLSLSDFAPLADVPNVEFFSLQKGKASSQAENPPNQMRLHNFSSQISDFVDTAAIIKCLDLVITIDTSVAHLAGALNCSVWTLLRFNHCWRYLLERKDSPWYPSMKLYRQSSEGDWKNVIQQVAIDLRNELTNPVT
jgi:Tfp pilus assembly protein PilF